MRKTSETAGMPRNRIIVDMLVAASLVAVTTGCSEAKPEPNDDDRMTRAVLGIVGEFYGDYLDAHQGKPPDDSQDFYDYLDSRMDALLLYNVEHPDQLYHSHRDNKPLVIVSGGIITTPDAPGSPWAAIEQEGVDGKVYAVRVRGGIHELSQEEATELFSKN